MYNSEEVYISFSNLVIFGLHFQRLLLLMECGQVKCGAQKLALLRCLFLGVLMAPCSPLPLGLCPIDCFDLLLFLPVHPTLWFTSIFTAVLYPLTLHGFNVCDLLNKYLKSVIRAKVFFTRLVSFLFYWCILR